MTINESSTILNISVIIIIITSDESSKNHRSLNQISSVIMIKPVVQSISLSLVTRNQFFNLKLSVL
jgi:hypothetical protein